MARLNIKNMKAVLFTAILFASSSVFVAAFATPKNALPFLTLRETFRFTKTATWVQAPTLPRISWHLRKGWHTKDSSHIGHFIDKLKKRNRERVRKQGYVTILVQPIQDLKDMVAQVPALHRTAEMMIKEAGQKEDPLGEPSLRSWEEFLILLNEIMVTAPEYTVCGPDPKDPCGLIGCPINALLNWPMQTEAGYMLFSNQLINHQLQKILNHWAEEFLTQPESTYVFHKNDISATPKVYGWLSPQAKEEMAQVVIDASDKSEMMPFEDIFECDKEDLNLGFTSWDAFFTRIFRPGIRPVDDPDDLNVIVSACESAPLQLVKDIKFNDKFWLKDQPYSIQDMLDSHPLAHLFIGGTAYQAFLSALSYHRWNSPVDGVIEDVYTVDGSYYLENREITDDSAAPDAVQPFLTSVASRAVIFIRANSEDIGLMCFVAVGMAEVSTCEITVKKGDRVKKGDELGMFHFGGSTHCLLFQKDKHINFIDIIADPKKMKEHNKNIAVLSKIAWANDASY